jgi:hypothetical protein
LTVIITQQQNEQLIAILMRTRLKNVLLPACIVHRCQQYCSALLHLIDATTSRVAPKPFEVLVVKVSRVAFSDFLAEPEQWTQIQAPLKFYKLIVDELSNLYQNHDDIEEGSDEVSDLMNMMF